MTRHTAADARNYLNVAERKRFAAAPSSSAAMPKRYRHTFGVAAFQAVPPHIVERWLGHASLSTIGTAM